MSILETVLGTSAAGYVSQAASLWSAYQSYEAAETQQELATESYKDSIAQAWTNGNLNLSYMQLEKASTDAYNSSVRESNLISATNSYNISVAQIDSQRVSASASAMLNLDTAAAETRLQMETAIAQAKQDIQFAYDSASLDVEYALAQAETAMDYNSTKALMEAMEYKNAAGLALQFVDVEINQIMENINSVRENYDVATSDAVGKEIIKFANTVTAGGSSARRAMNTLMQSDKLKQAAVKEQTDALTKAYATQQKTISETKNNVSNTLMATNLANKQIGEETINNVQNIISNTELSSEEKLSQLEISLDTQEASYDIATAQIMGQYNITMDELNSSLDIAGQSYNNTVDNINRQYNITQAQADSSYDLENIQQKASLLLTAEKMLDSNQFTEDEYATNITNLLQTDPELTQKATDAGVFNKINIPTITKYDAEGNAYELDLVQAVASGQNLEAINKANEIGVMVNETNAKEKYEAYVANGGSDTQLADSLGYSSVDDMYSNISMNLGFDTEAFKEVGPLSVIAGLGYGLYEGTTWDVVNEEGVTENVGTREEAEFIAEFAAADKSFKGLTTTKNTGTLSEDIKADWGSSWATDDLVGPDEE